MDNINEDNIENLWSDCMNDGAMQTIYKESHLVLLGDSGSGK